MSSFREDFGELTVGDALELNKITKEMEDYEELESFWMIDTCTVTPVSRIVGKPYEIDKEIGNHFESKEEAELAVRKLKAWKRLKDGGFRFIDHIDRDSGQGMTRYEWDGYVNCEDLDLLFGGEE